MVVVFYSSNIIPRAICLRTTPRYSFQRPLIESYLTARGCAWRLFLFLLLLHPSPVFSLPRRASERQEHRWSSFIPATTTPIAWSPQGARTRTSELNYLGMSHHSSLGSFGEATRKEERREGRKKAATEVDGEKGGQIGRQAGRKAGCRE